MNDYVNEINAQGGRLNWQNVEIGQFGSRQLGAVIAYRGIKVLKFTVAYNSITHDTSLTPYLASINGEHERFATQKEAVQHCEDWFDGYIKAFRGKYGRPE
jgi:hypothetical protein